MFGVADVEEHHDAIIVNINRVGKNVDDALLEVLVSGVSIGKAVQPGGNVLLADDCAAGDLELCQIFLQRGFARLDGADTIVYARECRSGGRFDQRVDELIELFVCLADLLFELFYAGCVKAFCILCGDGLRDLANALFRQEPFADVIYNKQL